MDGRGTPERSMSGSGEPKTVVPEIAEDVLASDLDRAARGRLRTLSKDNADGVARHLVMAGRLIDDDPELAYAHAQAAVRRAGRVDVVREAAALTAYRTGRYAEALRELRTVRRLNGSDEHLALMADCERGLGRPDRALALAQEDSVRELPSETQVELLIVVSGARLDLGDPGAALAALSAPLARAATGELAERVLEARATALEAAGRTEEAAELLRALPAHGRDEDEVVVFDLEDDSDEVGSESTSDVPEPGGDASVGESASVQGNSGGVSVPEDLAASSDRVPGIEPAHVEAADGSDGGGQSARGTPDGEHPSAVERTESPTDQTAHELADEPRGHVDGAEHGAGERLF